MGSSVASWGRLKTVVEPLEGMLGGNLESSSDILTNNGGNLELSWALLAPSVANITALTTRGPPPGAQGGGRGRGKPLPEGEYKGDKGEFTRP